jgi:hypothetical protein
LQTHKKGFLRLQRRPSSQQPTGSWHGASLPHTARPPQGDEAGIRVLHLAFLLPAFLAALRGGAAMLLLVLLPDGPDGCGTSLITSSLMTVAAAAAAAAVAAARCFGGGGCTRLRVIGGLGLARVGMTTLPAVIFTKGAVTFSSVT